MQLSLSPHVLDSLYPLTMWEMSVSPLTDIQ